jgi:hypothetical protein
LPPAIYESAVSGLGLQGLVLKHVDIQSIVMGMYVCDFGNVILGSTKRKVFQVTNLTTAGALSWSFDRKALG